MTDRTDHAAKAVDKLDVANDSHPDAQLRLIARAQVHATLALVDAVDHLAAGFGQCPHGYTVCPYCIRDGIRGFQS